MMLIFRFCAILSSIFFLYVKAEITVVTPIGEKNITFENSFSETFDGNNFFSTLEGGLRLSVTAHSDFTEFKELDPIFVEITEPQEAFSENSEKIILSSDKEKAFVVGDLGFHVLNISDPRKRIPMSNFTKGSTTQSLFLVEGENKAYVGFGNSLSEIDIADLNNLTETKTFGSIDNILTMQIDSVNNLGYLGTTVGIQVINLNTMSETSRNQTVTNIRSSVSANDNDNIFFGTQKGILIFDNGTFIGQYNTADSLVFALAISSDDNTLFFTTKDGDNSNFTILDVSDPSNPIEISNTLITNENSVSNVPNSIFYLESEEYLFIACAQSGLFVFDVSNTTEPTKLVTFTSTGSVDFTDLSLDGNRNLVFLTGGNGIVLVSFQFLITLEGENLGAGNQYSIDLQGCNYLEECIIDSFDINIQCEIGYYVDSLTCAQCFANSTTSIYGGKAISDCFCIEGFEYDSLSSNCSSCPVDTFKESIGNEICTSCAFGETTDGFTGATTNICQCNSGFFFNSSNLCQECEVNTFKDFVGSAICLNCNSVDPFSSTNSTGSISSDDCLCNEGFYKNSSNYCVQCPINTYKNVLGNDIAQCLDCPLNSISNEGSISMDQCICMHNWTKGSGNDCDVCPGNFDMNKNCSECRNNWNGENCDQCEPPNIEINDCLPCSNQNYNQSSNCGSCIGNWDIFNNCSLCLPNFNFSTNCNDCEDYWIGNNCSICPELYKTDGEGRCNLCANLNGVLENGCQIEDDFNLQDAVLTITIIVSIIVLGVIIILLIFISIFCFVFTKDNKEVDDIVTEMELEELDEIFKNRE